MDRNTRDTVVSADASCAEVNRGKGQKKERKSRKKRFSEKFWGRKARRTPLFRPPASPDFHNAAGGAVPQVFGREAAVGGGAR
jgi:hypothetical protein